MSPSPAAPQAASGNMHVLYRPAGAGRAHSPRAVAGVGLRHSDKPAAGPHDEWFRKPPPPAVADGRREEQVRRPPAGGIEREHRNPPSRLDAVQMKTGNDPVVGE